MSSAVALIAEQKERILELEVAKAELLEILQEACDAGTHGPPDSLQPSQVVMAISRPSRLPSEIA